ncbi:putative membrane protein [Rhodanobacter sp. ANJX3]|uniref:glycosyltransferase family 39 protein n=1 Tax=Rhodanobacter sp. ANJX3 TaxID=2723083 RepID=UPI00161DAC27|nr:glycosyltransferase family 39 protein [Rhodanobacter sp. ANJX3]MBB5358211.1 putative membrane protein [Rhodanobacter sp. ANJX3]
MLTDTQMPSGTGTFSARDAAWLLIIVFIGLTARLMHIDSQPFWLDEALTYQRVHLGIGSLIADSFSNRHMPSYFLMLQAISPLDTNNAGLRIPSALFGTASIAVVFTIARRVAGRAAAVVAALLMALSPLQVQYGQEARSYTLVTLLITVALWGLVRLAQNSRGAALDFRHAEFDRFGWGAYVLGTIGALDVLGDAAPWLLAANLSLYLIWRSLCTPHNSEASRCFRRNWLFSAGLILMFCVPFYGAILAFSDGQMLQKFDWIPPLSWQNLRVAAKSTYLMRMAAVVRFSVLPTVVPLLGLLVAALGGIGLYRMRRRLEGRVLLLGFAVLPLLLLAVSLVKSMVLPRYILWSAAPFFILVGIGATALPRRMLPVAITALLLLCTINLLPIYHTETKPRWDRAAATLAAHVRPGDTVFTGDANAPTMLAVLQPKDQVPIDQSALVTSRLDVALARWKQGSRVWAVNGRSAMGPGITLDAFKSRIAALGTPALEIPEGKEITILMFDAPGTAGSTSPRDNTDWRLTPPIATAIETLPVSRRRIAP